MHRRTSALTAVGVAAALLLAGCSGPSPAATTGHKYTQIPEPTSTPASTQPLAEEISKNVLVTVYPGTQFTAKHGCGCSLKGDSSEELFPKGTTVMLLKITLTGTWSPDQGTGTTQDVTGLTFQGTKFEGRPENAVIDTKDGPSAASRLHLPWQADGLFHSTPWTITNNKPVAFAVAWYVPRGVNRLDLVVNIPSEKRATDLFVDIPQSVLALDAPGGE